MDPFLFVRVGHLEFYDERRDTEDPVAGGAFNRADVGSEVNNFRPYRGHVYGFAQAGRTTGGYNLSRIHRTAEGEDEWPGVLVVSVARQGGAGKQVIVGWHRNATVYSRWVGKRPGGLLGGYNFRCSTDDAVLLPLGRRDFHVPKGAGGMGQANVFYGLTADGRPRTDPWLVEALQYVESHGGSKPFSPQRASTEPGEPSEPSPQTPPEPGHRSAVAQATPGRRYSVEERKAIEHIAMARAIAYFSAKGYEVLDVHATSPFDLRCRKKGEDDLTVEVKGTTGRGEKVIVTRGEVESARARRAALFIVSELEMERRGKRVVLTGGSERCILPWIPQDEDLLPINLAYTVPDA